MLVEKKREVGLRIEVIAPFVALIGQLRRHDRELASAPGAGGELSVTEHGRRLHLISLPADETLFLEAAPVKELECAAQARELCVWD